LRAVAVAEGYEGGANTGSDDLNVLRIAKIDQPCRTVLRITCVFTISFIRLQLCLALQDGFIHIAASGWISVNTEEKKKQTLYTKS